MDELVLAEAISSTGILAVGVMVLATVVGLTIIIGGMVSKPRLPHQSVDPEPAKLGKVNTTAALSRESKIRSGVADVPAQGNPVASDEPRNDRPADPKPTKLSLIHPTAVLSQESKIRSGVADVPTRGNSVASDGSGNEGRIFIAGSKGVPGRQPEQSDVGAPPVKLKQDVVPERPTSSGIFISYRRQDEPNFAGRLYDRLVARFGRDDVFMDVDTIELGVDFLQVIEQSLSRCGVMIVVIGKGWVSAVDEDGEMRLKNPDDYVRLEIERALLSATRVIPVLVEGAAIPKAAQLPQSLSPLSRRNGLSMSHASFSSDTDRLIETLSRILTKRGSGQNP